MGYSHRKTWKLVQMVICGVFQRDYAVLSDPFFSFLSLSSATCKMKSNKVLRYVTALSPTGRYECWFQWATERKMRHERHPDYHVCSLNKGLWYIGHNQLRAADVKRTELRPYNDAAQSE